jgi:DNA-binding transcriptional ArsR family regulator
MMQDKARFFKALGEDTRITIIQCLLAKERCACSFSAITKKDQTTISRHLKILAEAGILRYWKKGRNIYYAIKDANMRESLLNLGLKAKKSCQGGI